MTKLSKLLLNFFGFFLFLSVLGGCGAHNVRMNMEYRNRVTEAKLQFAPVTKVPHIISVSAKEYKEVPPSIRQSQAYEAQEIMQKVPTVLPLLMVKAAQENCGLKIKTDGDSETSLILTLHDVSTTAYNSSPAKSALEKYEALMSPGGYREINSTHWFVYQIELRDNKTGKEIWYGESSLGVNNFSNTSQGQANFAKAVGVFASNIALEIDKTDLVKKAAY
jgi:hypothetical protein